ncbi:MAG TPA: ParB/RepB/Spo0J family partition protein, partial [Bacteroidia bacterium]|nr:ParB/RepB/Spo0J family partition protein [Bacteroidia bacterium]
SIEKIETNPFQPRTDFEEHALKELSESIRQQGIIQPITVRKLGYDRYQIISGERRFRASKLAGLEVIPAYIRIANDQAMLEMALVENIQRENLNPIEIGISYKRLIDECNLSQEELADKVGKDRSTVTNYMRLLKL